MERILSRHRGIKVCRFITKTGNKCSRGATIDGLCITHYRIENGIDNSCSNIKKLDVTIHLWKED